MANTSAGVRLAFHGRRDVYLDVLTASFGSAKLCHTDNWAFWVPGILKQNWASLSIDARVAAYLVAKAVAEAISSSGNSLRLGPS